MLSNPLRSQRMQINDKNIISSKITMIYRNYTLISLLKIPYFQSIYSHMILLYYSASLSTADKNY